MKPHRAASTRTATEVGERDRHHLIEALLKLVEGQLKWVRHRGHHTMDQN